MKRREFMVGCSAAIAAMAGSRITGYGFSPQSSATGEIFIYIFLRGGCDGLNLVAPVNDPNYVSDRGADVRIAESGDNVGLSLNNGLAGLDFRLHFKAPELKELYDSNALAIIHAAGLTNGTRSHFDAMDIIERGSLNDKNLNEGWFTRYLNSTSGLNADQFASLAIGTGVPTSFLGNTTTIAINNVNDCRLYGDKRYQNLLQDMYKGNTLLDEAARNALESIAVIDKHITRDSTNKPLPYTPENNASYPDNSLGKSLQTLAQVIKMDVGLQVASVDYGGWDTHENQRGVFANLTEGLSKSLAAFYNDLNAYQSRLTILVMSEFGRRLKSNKSNGTDHGHGNAMLVLGGNVKGGKMYGQWPGLDNEQLDNHVDLAVTTDYRTVLSEIIMRRLSNPKLGHIFPGYKEYNPLGFINGKDLKVDYAG